MKSCRVTLPLAGIVPISHSGPIEIGEYNLFFSEVWKFYTEMIGPEGQFGVLDGNCATPRGKRRAASWHSRPMATTA